MIKRIAIMSLVMSIALVCAFLYTGCEDDPSMPSVGQYFADNPYQSAARPTTDTALTISPESAQISFIGQAVSFRVTGGNNSTYTWTCANGNGTINPAYPGAYDATYQVVTVNPNTVIVYDSDGRSAAAPITVASPDALQIVPNSLRIAVPSGAVQLEVIGGLPPYNPAVGVSDLTLGTAALAGSTITYTPLNSNGVQTITVIDDNNDTATATVTQD